MKRKFCVFCGEKPVNKNKEHIIPQWLIQITDKPNRRTIVGLNQQGRELEIPWKRFEFPSCTECNENFGKQERKVKKVVLNLLNDKPVSHAQMDLLLDWLDKVRVGLYLAKLIHKKMDIDPRFYINHRVGEKDRVCLIYKIDDNEKGIGMIGVETPIFHLVPSCFSLVINNLCFFNYSKEFIVSEGLGFPFPSKYDIIKGKIIVEEFNIGNSKESNQALAGSILKPSIRLYQSILIGEHGLNKPRIGKSAKFYKNNCLNFLTSKIKSRIYLMNDYEGIAQFWSAKKTYGFSNQPKINRVLLEKFLVKMVLEHQIQSAKQHFDKSEKELIEKYLKLIKINEDMLKEVDDFLRQTVPHYYK
jgi:hypothetical protein